MENQNFSYRIFIRKASVYFRLLAKKKLFDLGAKSGKMINLLLLGVISLLFAPLFFTILFVSLGFAFKAWIPSAGYPEGFLLSAATVLLIAIIAFIIFFVRLSRTKAKIYSSILKITGEKNTSSNSPEEEKNLPTLYDKNDTVSSIGNEK